MAREEKTSGSREEVFSVSRLLLDIIVSGRGAGKIALFRHMAPLTVNAIKRALPIESRASVQPGAMVCLFTSVRVGVEKSKTNCARGEVAFLPSGALLCVFVRNVQSDKPLNPIGKVEKGLEVFEAVRSGDVVRLIEAQPA